MLAKLVQRYIHVLRQEPDPQSLATKEILFSLHSACLALAGETTKWSGVGEAQGVEEICINDCTVGERGGEEDGAEGEIGERWVKGGDA